MDNLKFTKEELLKFIKEAHQQTYAAAKDIKNKHRLKTPLIPEHKEYDYKKDNWHYHDSYAGWLCAPGKEIIFFKGKPVWTMSYQGRVDYSASNDFIEEIYIFLKKALMNIDEEKPFRGPEYYKEGDFEYSFNYKGNYDFFIGKEVIRFKEKDVYVQHIMASLIIYDK